jgi:holo-[acyl-carrier protein] synthase
VAPGVTGVGMDLLEIDRLERALTRRPRLAERLFTDDERAFAAARGQPARHLAVCFCAKEAVAKALQLRVWDWRDVEVRGGGDEPPSVRLAGAAAARARELGASGVQVSLTHSKGMAGAVAVVE